MIPENIRLFVETLDYAFVASADPTGVPHLAAGTDPRIPDPLHVAFEAWFCRKTLLNVAQNPRVAVAVVMPESGAGYQFIGTVDGMVDTALLDGFLPGAEEPGMPQIQYRLVVRVEQVMEFSAGVHSDRPQDVGSQ